jgi:putative transposase
MPQSLSSVLVHLIFSTKNREPYITPQIEPELYPYMATIFRELRSPTLAIGGVYDHLHVLFSLARVMRIAELVEAIKTDTSKWIKTKGYAFRNFHWQKGYGAFSVGQSEVAAVKSYIQNQKQHHRGVTFQDEYRALLKSYRIPHDERYMWD